MQFCHWCKQQNTRIEPQEHILKGCGIRPDSQAETSDTLSVTVVMTINETLAKSHNFYNLVQLVNAK